MVVRHALSAPWHAGRARRGGLLALSIAVVLVHGYLTRQLSERMADLAAAPALPPRIEVAYVRELTPEAPSAVAPRIAPPRPSAPRRVRPARPAASAPSPGPAPVPESVAQGLEPAMLPPDAELEPELSPPAVPPRASAPDLEPVPLAAAEVRPPPDVAPAPEASASAAPAFDWPGSTRLSYKLTGMVRGEVHGDAQVEWIRVGTRYQVHLDVTLGLPIAPLMTRRMSSEGELTAEGLTPRRYDEDTKVAFRDRRRVTMHFEPDAVVLPGGQRRERWPGMQDTASQFVQLSWLFTTRPELLRTGATVEVPLALPRNVDRWVYEVLEDETLYTPFGEIRAYHLKPRRVSRPGGDMTAEIWFAPRLRYLPVRIRIHQDAETFIDLMLARRPELAAP